MRASIQNTARAVLVGVVAVLLVAAVKKAPELGRTIVLRQVLTSGDCTPGTSGAMLKNPAFGATPDAAGYVPTCEALSLRMLEEAFNRAVVATVDAKDGSFNDSPMGLQSSWKQLGADLFQKLPNYDNRNDPARYDAKGLQLAFDLLYVKPNTVIGGVKAQELYDRLFRASFEYWGLQVARVLNTKGFVDEMLPLMREAMKDRDAWLLGFYGVAARELSGGDGGREVSGRVLGWVLRRANDGTLKTLTGLIERVLKDYDPSLHRKFVDPDTGLNDGTVAVRFNVSPKMEWSVAIDGKPGCEGCSRLRLKPGKHRFEFTGEGESASSVELDVSAKARDLRVQLERQSWEVPIRSLGPAVDVTVDGVLQGKTPIAVPMRFGKHVIATNDPCVHPEKTELTVTPTKPEPVELRGLPKLATLRVERLDASNTQVDGVWSVTPVETRLGLPAVVPLCSRSVTLRLPPNAISAYPLALFDGKPNLLTITPSTPKRPKEANWTTTGAAMLEGESSVRVTCPPKGSQWMGTIWGTGPFKSDSAVCVAAAYAGKVKLDTGGEVTIRASSSQRDYRSGSLNGINSQSRYGADQVGFTID